MAVPLKLDLATLKQRQFTASDDLQIDAIVRRAGSGNITIGSNLGAAEELVLGSATSDVRILGDLIVDGSSTINVDETVLGVFSVEGDVSLGNNDGDVIDIGGGSTDIININSDLIVGAGSITVGSSVTDYLSELWLAAVNANGPNLAAYNLAASGTNAGAYSIGIDPSLLTNATATDLMTALTELDSAIGTGGTLQSAYEGGNTIAVTTAEGAVTITNDTDATNTLNISRAPGSATAGNALNITMGANASGAAVFVNNSGTGNALQVQDAGADVLAITGAGALTATPTSGQSLTMTVAGAGVVDINTGAGGVTIDATGGGVSIDAGAASNFTTSAGTLALSAGGSLDLDGGSTITIDAVTGVSIDGGAASNFSTSAGNITIDAAAAELVLDDVGNSSITLSQSADRVLDETASGEVLDGATSIIGAINRLAREVTVAGQLLVELPIQNTITIAAGSCVAASTVSGRVTNATSVVGGNFRFVGICITGGTGDAGGTVICRFSVAGLVTDSGAAFTAGDALFIPETAGRPVPLATISPLAEGDLAKQLGYAITSTSYILGHGLPETVA